ncbi:MAG: LuxR C-terminal-related transcriptional regulator [Thermomicrobiales bacterium]
MAERADLSRHGSLSPAPEYARAFLTAREAAQLVGVNEKTIRRAIARGDLRALKHGRSFSILVEDLHRYRAGRNTDRPARFPRDLAHEIGVLTSLKPLNQRLPTPLTRFIGREQDVEVVVACFAQKDVRLVTLTGPGGVGKTRLALRLAEQLSAGLAGAAFVPLAPVRRVDHVLPAVAQAIGIQDTADIPVRDTVIASLQSGVFLVVLDNLEHLPDAGLLLVDLASQCPELRLLATSRVPLHVSGEHVVQIAPLPLPSRRKRSGRMLDQDWLNELTANTAIQLFVDRGRAADADFGMTPANAGDVAALVARTDGLPLAIELAAARLRYLTVGELLSQMGERLPLLTDGPRDQPGRLQSMRDAIGWSYELLTAPEQTLFRHLSVFEGGFTVGAVEAVVSKAAELPLEDAPSRMHPVKLLARLIDHSLVQREVVSTGETRYALLETVREYGLELLRVRGESPTARDAHAAWCLSFAELAERELAGSQQSIWLKRLESELPNIRAAHEWLNITQNLQASLRLAGAAGWLWSSAPHLAEGRQRFDDLLATAGVERYPELLARALATAGDIADWSGDQPRAQALYERALSLYRELGDLRNAVSMLRGLASSAIDRGDLQLAQQLLAESLQLAEEIGHRWEFAAISNLQGIVARVQGDFPRARSKHRLAVETWRTLEDHAHVATALNSLGWASWLAGDLTSAAGAFHESLTRFGGHHDTWGTLWCVTGAACIAAKLRGRDSLASTLLAASQTERRHLAGAYRPHDQRVLDEVMSNLRRDLGPAAFATAWDHGTMLSLAEMTAMSERFLAECVASGQSAGATELLTAREREVLGLLVEGQSDKMIASTLFLSRRTASNHVSRILAKLGASSRMEAVAIARRQVLL